MKQRKYYLGNYEVEEKPDGSRRMLHYIGGEAGTAAVYVLHSTGEDTLYSVFTDHLGSWKTVVKETDGQIFRQSFDAWGRKRNPQNWNSSVCSAFPFDRGYTGHQHLDEFGLINMNGRMYDVGLCRFLSPDPYVQMPDYTQNFNRYSYCLNNPLKYVDPTGYYMAAFDLYKESRREKYMSMMSQPGIWDEESTLFGLPGQNGNGTGLGGVYYDWSTGMYRSVDNGNYVAPWSYVSGIASNYTSSAELTFQGHGSVKSDGSIVLKNTGEVNVFRFWEVGGAVASAMSNSGSSELLIHNSWFNSSIARNMIPDVMTVEGDYSIFGGSLGISNKDQYGNYLISADIGLGIGIGGSASIGEKTNIIHFLTIW